LRLRCADEASQKSDWAADSTMHGKSSLCEKLMIFERS
jgi:hypothetical protein